VDASVEAILRAIWPDLPMPDRIMRPLYRQDLLNRGDEIIGKVCRQAHKGLALMLQHAGRGCEDLIALQSWFGHVGAFTLLGAPP